jgi:hypothetical protein
MGCIHSEERISTEGAERVGERRGFWGIHFSREEREEREEVSIPLPKNRLQVKVRKAATHFSFAFFAPSRETNLLSKFAPFGECTPPGCALSPLRILTRTMTVQIEVWSDFV